MDSRTTPSETTAVAEPRFDVFIRLPRGMTPEEAQRRVEMAGLTAAQGANICAALRQVPVVQVRKSIDESRARKTEHQLSLAGLKVEVRRVPTAPHAAPPSPPIPDASAEEPSDGSPGVNLWSFSVTGVAPASPARNAADRPSGAAASSPPRAPAATAAPTPAVSAPLQGADLRAFASPVSQLSSAAPARPAGAAPAAVLAPTPVAAATVTPQAAPAPVAPAPGPAPRSASTPSFSSVFTAPLPAAASSPVRHAAAPPAPPAVPVAERSASTPPRAQAARAQPLDEDPEDFEFNLRDPSEEDTIIAPYTTRPQADPDESLPPPAAKSPAARRARPRWAPWLWAAALVALGAAGFTLGRLSLPWTAPPEPQINTTQSIDKVLTAVGAPPAMSPVPASSASSVDSAGGADASGLAPDSLTQIAKAERAQGRGMTLEQAVAQMQGAKVNAGLLLPGDQLPAKLAQAAASPTSAGPSAQPNGSASPLPASLRATLMADMAVELAAFGQTGRAKEVLSRLHADAGLTGDPAVGASARRAEVLLAAWGLRDAAVTTIDRQIGALRTLVYGIESPAARAALMGSVATILARHDNVPDALALAFLADAGEALKSVADGSQRQVAIDDWLVDTGDLLLAQLARHARLGRWSLAQSLAGQLDTLAGQARSPHAVLLLQALRARAQELMGQPAKAEKLLAEALKVWQQRGTPARQAEELRALASRTGGIGQPILLQVTAQLATAADALHGADRARALTQLALMQAEAGEAERFEALKAMLRQSPEAARPEQAALTAQLLVSGELSAARAEQRSGAFGLAEARVRKVAAYLL
ncbi:hypothetical protein AACH06_06425 [Ideonella sp. DXS29W]|uniref:Uncharacterized protein n=1 Tax=Ideonella lacteola TaxID=2984193 RepID=A0ABU9BKG2_9BURK